MEAARLEPTNIEFIATYAMLALIGIIIIFSLFKINDTIKLIGQVADDTLKRVDDKGVLRWSRTSLTMGVAIALAVYMTIADFIHEGFNFEVFCAWLTVGLGSKVTDAWSRKLDPSVQPPTGTPPTEGAGG